MKKKKEKLFSGLMAQASLPPVASVEGLSLLLGFLNIEGMPLSPREFKRRLGECKGIRITVKLTPKPLPKKTRFIFS